MYAHSACELCSRVHEEQILIDWGGGTRALCPALFLVARPPDPGTLSLVCVSWCEYNNCAFSLVWGDQRPEDRGWVRGALQNTHTRGPSPLVGVSYNTQQLCLCRLVGGT